jgi:hypothetical protein
MTSIRMDEAPIRRVIRVSQRVTLCGLEPLDNLTTAVAIASRIGCS